MKTHLLTNARIFDGNSDKLTGSTSLLVEGNKITTIARSITAPSDATVIDAKGRTVTPTFSVLAIGWRKWPRAHV